MSKIEVKYEDWKNKLLDLGKRNKLLNYKEYPKSTLKITKPECRELYESFVDNEKPVVFPVDSEYVSAFDDCNENEQISLFDDGNNEIEDEYRNEYIATNHSLKELQKVLRLLRSKSKVSLEERGVNTLYLCFGFLEWTESGHSKIVYKSPLVLVPVTIKQESISSPFIMELHDDEVVFNPTLNYKLKSDFNISVPDFDGDIDDFFNQLSKKIKGQKWSINYDVSLGMLSFLKINMYEDLSKHQNTFLQNPIIKSISGEVEYTENIPEGLENYDFDSNDKPEDIFQVVDADSSQQEAILYAKKV